MKKNFMLVCIALILAISLIISCDNSSKNPDAGKITVTFDTDGGCVINPVKVGLFQTVTEPEKPTKEGYTFVGWYLGDEKYDFSKPVISNITLVAKWNINILNVKFDSNGGSKIESKQINYGSTITLPSIEQEGYDFLGWTLDDDIFTEETQIKKDITLKALWGNEKSIEGEYVAFITNTNLAYKSLANTLSNTTEGNTVVILSNIDNLSDALGITQSITIEGKGHYIKSVNGDSKRVININDTTNNINLVINNLEIIGPTSGSYTRGISAYNNSGKVYIELNNCKVSCNYYAIHSASNNENIKVVANNCTAIGGWCAVQTWSSNSTFEFNNCELIGLNDKNYNGDGWNDFGTVVVNSGVTNSTFNFNNTKITAKETTGNIQVAFDIRGTNTNIKLNNNSQIVLKGNNSYSFVDKGENNTVYKDNNLVSLHLVDTEQITYNTDSVTTTNAGKEATGTLIISYKRNDYAFNLNNCPKTPWDSRQGTDYYCKVFLENEMIEFDFDVSTEYDGGCALYLTEFIK